MSWSGVEGHDAVAAQFARAVARGRLANSYLFCGPPGIGKRLFATRLAQSLLCLDPPEGQPLEGLSACGQCPSCKQIDAGTHPDLLVVSRPEGRANIPIDLLIGDSDHRMRAGFCYDVAMKPFMSPRKVGIIDDADWLNVEGANSLLKTLEEPPLDSVLILISTSIDKQLPTIRSRCQTIRFAPLDDQTVAKLLLAGGLCADAVEAETLARFGAGSVQRATEARDPELWEFRMKLLARLAEADFDTLAVAASVSEFVGKAGREADLRRKRLRQTIEFAIDFYRQALRGRLGAAVNADDRTSESVARRLAGDGIGVERLARCLERSLEATVQLERNVHLTTLVDAWIDDLGAIARQVPSTSHPVGVNMTGR